MLNAGGGQSFRKDQDPFLAGVTGTPPLTLPPFSLSRWFPPSIHPLPSSLPRAGSPAACVSRWCARSVFEYESFTPISHPLTLIHPSSPIHHPSPLILIPRLQALSGSAPASFALAARSRWSSGTRELCMRAVHVFLVPLPCMHPLRACLRFVSIVSCPPCAPSSSA